VIQELISYIPIATTIFAVYFFIIILRHYRQKPKALYLLWWTIGVFTYGFGTLTESIHALAGWSELNTKVWYISGALLGGFPLAQGTVYLLMKRRTAHILTGVLCTIVLVAAVCVALSPVTVGADFNYRLTGHVFDWQWVRGFSPFINSYSFVFLFGGAVYSAYQYAKKGRNHPRFLGNVFIGLGALLPGIGGSFTRFGYVEVLFVTELVGLLCIYYGYHIMRKDSQVSIHKPQQNQVLAETSI
jgi:hypothetical protein